MNSVSVGTRVLPSWVSSLGLALALGLSGCGGGDDAAVGTSDGMKRLALAAFAVTEADQAKVVAITQVSQKRISRTVFEYVLNVTVLNGASPQIDVQATLTSVGTGTTVIDGSVVVGSMAANAQVISADTIKLRHDRTYPFDLTKLTFKVVQTAGSIAPAPSNPPFAVDLTPAAIAALGGNGVGDFAYESAALSGRDRPAAKFSAGYLRVPNSSAMQFTDGATFDFWARIDSNTGMTGYGQYSNSSWFMTLLAKSHDRSGVGFLMPALNPAIGTGFGYVLTASFDPSWASSGCQNFPAVSNVAVGSWFRMTIAISSTTGWRQYVNKQLVYSCASSRPDFALMNTQDLFIGRFSDNFWYPLNGAISDIRIHQKALTAAEVTALP